MTLGEAFTIRLKRHLKERGITLYKFLKEANISRSTIVNLFIGNTKSPTLSTLYQVSDGLGITPIEFLDCEEFRSENLQYH